MVKIHDFENWSSIFKISNYKFNSAWWPSWQLILIRLINMHNHVNLNKSTVPFPLISWTSGNVGGLVNLLKH